jgi:hypothetical protein
VTLARAGAGTQAAETIADRVDPERWILWRCGPFPFPAAMAPRDPELLPEGPPIDFGEMGADLVVVLPEVMAPGYEGDALRAMVRLIRKKTPRAETASTDSLTSAQRQKHLLVLGGEADAERLTAGAGRGLLAGFDSGGYRITRRRSPFAPGRWLILGLGADPRGTWAAAAVLAFAIHPQADRLGELRAPWPVHMGDGTYWAAFDAENRGEPDGVSPAANHGVAPAPRPRVPFGVRIWGSPMPTPASYGRLMRALAGLEINTVVVQPGGWPDTPDCVPRVRAALDAAWSEGLFTILYVGNEIEAHKPAPLSASHEAMVTALDDHPGLLGWHLYNQLAATLAPAERELVRVQMLWLRAHTSKPVANEVVWGHNLVEPPADKVALVDDLKRWGMSALATDYAPVGGWVRQPELSRWEGRLLAVRRFDLPLEAVLQAHVPFLDPQVPRDVELRSQFWWALAGGARAFYFECAYNFTHFSNRGLLTWDLREQSDGRCAEIRRLAGIARRLAPLIADGETDDTAETAAFGLRVEPTSGEAIALRLRRAAGGTRWLLLINPALDQAVTTTVTLDAHAPALRLEELVPGPAPGSVSIEFKPGRPLVARIPPAGGACFRWALAEPERR